MRTILLLLISLIVFSCSPHQKTNPRFAFKKLSFTGYSWNINDSLMKNEFYVGEYLEIDSMGNCMVAKREYFQTTLSTEFDTLINKIKFSQLDTAYFPPKDNPIMYCGLTYCLSIEFENGSKKWIRYIPYSAPSQMKTLTKKLEELSEKVDSLEIAPFDYTKNTNYIKALYYTTNFQKSGRRLNL